MPSMLPPISFKFANIFFAVPSIFSAVTNRFPAVFTAVTKILVAIPQIFATIPAVFPTIEFIFPAIPQIFSAIKPSARMASFISIQFAVIIAIKTLELLFSENRFFIRIDGTVAIGVNSLPQRHLWL
jgi:hypothetical protein